LLTGTTPFPEKRLRSLGYGEMQRVIMEEEPERASTRLSTLTNEQKGAVARNHGEEFVALSKLLKGDLDWIVMKCLEKDRTRRYDTANGLSMDIQRHLDSEPITARPPSAPCRFQKLIRSNNVMPAAPALVLTAILVGTVISITQTMRAQRELRRALAAESQAQREKANVQAALHFIQDDVLSQASPGYQPDRELTVRA